MYSISKSYRFEAAHRLVAPYHGKCNSVHGHSFRVVLALSARELNACDMVEDFSSLKPVGEWIQAKLDHATLVAKSDQDLLTWLQKNGQKHFVTEGNPTSEILARVIFDKAEELGFKLSKVSVSETCTARAAYGR